MTHLPNTLVKAVISNDFSLFSELLEFERTAEEYNQYDENAGHWTLSPNANVLRASLSKALYEKNDAYLDCLLNHHKKFKNINIYDNDRDGQNALFYHNISDYFSEFTQLGMNSRLKNHKGHTPLLHAIYRNDAKTIETLIDANVYTKAKDKNGASALMLATINKSESTLKVLLNSNQFNDLKELRKIKEKKDTYFSQKLIHLLNEKIQIENEKKQFDFLINKPQKITPQIKRKI